MSLEVRRVVTGHDENGKARVMIDEISDNVISRRPGQESTVIWATDRHPPDLGDLDDISASVKQTTVPNGTVFRVSRLEPGVTPRTHRTESLDYAIVLAGEVDMALDDGETVHLTAGDVVVQRGTVHNWVNNGTEPCIMAYVPDRRPAAGRARRGRLTSCIRRSEFRQARVDRPACDRARMFNRFTPL